MAGPSDADMESEPFDRVTPLGSGKAAGPAAAPGAGPGGKAPRLPVPTRGSSPPLERPKLRRQGTTRLQLVREMSSLSPGATTLSFASMSPVADKSFRCEVWLFLSGSARGGAYIWAKRYQVLTAALIVMNVIADIFDSIDDLNFSIERSPSCRFLECFTFAVFILEYLLRLWSCVEDKHYKGAPVLGRLRFATTVMSVLDVCVLAVFYMDIMCMSDEARGLQVIRVLRMLTLLKMERHTSSFATICRVLAKKSHELSATLFMAMVLLVMASTSMYYLENPLQPDKFASIPDTMWWAVAAMTTVGYGDLVPVTTAGKLLASAVAFLGIGLFALPSGIVGSGFMEVLDKTRQAENDELANMIDEDGESIRGLQGDVASLRILIEGLCRSVQSTQAQVQAVHRNQEALLELLLHHRNSEKRASSAVPPAG